jgi:hypothetical protein
MTSKEQADMELSKKLCQEGIITTPGKPFEESQWQEINSLVANGVFEFIQYDYKGHTIFSILYTQRLSDSA